jgi:uncharacterized protein (TIGR02147 family)
MQQERPYYEQCIRRAFEERVARNPRYSLRAFANSLNMGSSALCQILSGARYLSAKSGRRLARALLLDPQEEVRFLASIGDTKLRKGLRRVSPELRKLAEANKASVLPVRDLPSEQFRVISDWYHYAILELTFAKGFRPDPKWIASSLGIGFAEAELALDRLFSLGLLARKADGSVVKVDDLVATADKSMSTVAHRKRQSQILEKSRASLEGDPLELRNHSSMTLALDPSRIPEAKRRIQAFARELTRFLESGENKRVYEMSISLFPLQSYPGGTQ